MERPCRITNTRVFFRIMDICLISVSSSVFKTKSREREMNALNEERKKRDEQLLLSEMSTNDVKRSEEIIKLRDKKATQVCYGCQRVRLGGQLIFLLLSRHDL